MGALRTVAAVAAASFLIQGVVWCVLSLLAVLSYSCNFSPQFDPLDVSFTAMAKIYFADDTCWDGGDDMKKLGLTSASVMITLSSLQFAFNFLVAIISLVLLFVIPRGSTYAFLIWLYSLIFFWMGTAILDLITSTTFNSDKNKLFGGTSTLPMKNGLVNMLLIASLVAARGYLYWALNVILMLYLLVAATMRLFKACKKLDEATDRRGNVNPAFEADDQVYPAHTAKSRWPWLGVPLWRRRAYPGREYTSNYRDRDIDELRDRMGFGRRENFQTQTNLNDNVYRNGYYENKKNLPRNGYLDNQQSNYPRRGPSDNHQNFSRNDFSENQQNGSPRYRWEMWPGNQAQKNQRLPSGSTETATPGYERQRPEHNGPRPNSLHEAILTVKPLRQVRPKLSDMQTKF